MTPIVFLGAALAGGLGAALRFFVDSSVKRLVHTGYPLGTTLINISGSLVLGLLTGLTLHNALTTSWELILGTGLIGGYTTFSTASFETVRLIQERRWLAGAINSLGMLTAAIAAAALGLWCGNQL